MAEFIKLFECVHADPTGGQRTATSFVFYVPTQKRVVAYTLDMHEPKLTPYTLAGPYGVVYDEEQTDGSRVVIVSQQEFPFARLEVVQPFSQVPQGLYEYKTEFRLTSADPGLTLVQPYLVIREPINWDAIRINLLRDPDTHGFSYEFTDGNVQLEFDEEAGKAALEQAYNLRGNDAELMLQFVLLKCEGEEIPYQGKINFNGYRKLEGKISASVERKSIAEQLRTRLDTKVSLSETLSLDGVDMGPAPTPNTISMHSKGIVKQLLAGVDSMTWGPELYTIERDVYGTFGFDSLKSSELKTFNPHLPGFVLDIVGLVPDYVALEAGRHEFDVMLKYKMLLSGYSNAFPQGHSHRHRVYFQYNDEAPELLHDIAARDLLQKQVKTPPTVANPNGGGGGTQTNPILVHFTRTIDMNAGDRISFYIQQNHSQDNEYFYWLRMEPDAYFKINALTRRPASKANSLLIFEALNRSLELVTSKPNVLRSKIFGRAEIGYPFNGIGALNIATNGYQIRQFESENRPMQPSVGSLYEGLDARYCLGMGIEIENDQEVVRIDSINHFYQDVEIMKLYSGADYSEEFAREMVWNELEFGYKKYLEGDVNTLDGFCTKHEYLTPIKTLKNKLSKISDLITDAYAIEGTRRQQFNEAPTTSWKYDDDIFMVAVVKYDYIRANIRISLPNLLEVSGSWPEIGYAPFIRIAGSLIDGSYNVERIELGDDTTKVWLLNNPIASNGLSLNARMYFDRPFYRPERLEKLATRSNGERWVSGLIDASTTYNLRHSIKNMLYAWEAVIRGALYYKQAEEFIKTTFIKNNNQLEAQWADNSMPGGLVIEKRDEYVYNLKPAIWRPERIRKTLPLSWEAFLYIKQCLQGQNIEGRNYGYVSIQDDCGHWVPCWIDEISYNPVEEMAEFKLLRKA